MRFWHRPRSVRISLTLWYVGAMMVVLGVYAAGVVIFVSQSVSRALDSRLRGDFQWAAEMWERRPDGTLSWFEGETGINEENVPWLQVWNPAGDLLFRTGVAYEQPLPDSGRLATEASGQIVPVPAGEATFRVLSGPSRLGGEPVIIQVARSEAPMRRELYHLMLMLALGLPLGVAAAGLGGYSLASRALRPVERMAARAQEITAERLSDRLPVDNPKDELGQLALVFNDTLCRLESSFEQMRRFTADVSHELRTPLTAIRNVGEVGLRVRRTDAEYRELIGSMLEEVDRLACLVDQLLAFSRAETGQARLTLESIDLEELARNVCGHLGVLAEEKMQSVTVQRAGAPKCVGDRLILRQALINLVDNAIKYSPVGAQIRIQVSESPNGSRIEVSDTGPGIAEETRTRIFDRFYRVGDSDFEDRGGAGLGLSIAKWAVEANGGHLTLEEATSSGSTFRIALPNPARVFIAVLLLGAVLGFASACTPQVPPPAPPFKATVPLAEVMHHIMMPAANEIWDRFGVIITAKGTIERFPKTEEDWVAMENGAVTLSEVPNLLMIPGYAKDNDEWMKAAVAMRDMGERVLKAVQSKNAAAVEEVAGEIDATCDVCHDKYPTTEVPASAEASKPAEASK